MSFSLIDETDNNLTKVSLGKNDLTDKTESGKQSHKVVIRAQNAQKRTNVTSYYDASDTLGSANSRPTSKMSKTITVDSGEVSKFNAKD